MRILAFLLIAAAVTGCAGYNVRVGLQYTQPDGSAIGGSVEIDPSFAKQKK